MLKIAVCDDDGFEAVLIATYIKEYQKSHPEIDIEYQIFHSSEELWLQLNKSCDFDIYLLDIIMPDMNGLELGRKIRNLGKEGILIYMTSSKDYALDAYEVYAMQYLVKPIELSKFCSTIDMAINGRDSMMPHCFTINSTDGKIKVPRSSICYINCQKHTMFYHLSDGRVIQSKNLRVSYDNAAADLLATDNFIRVHQSYIVNMAYATRLNNQSFDITINDTTVTVPISKNNHAMVKRKYFEYAK